jgi:hypothetical protein
VRHIPLNPLWVDDALDLRWMGGETWRLTREYLYATLDGLVQVPAGFLTDFASIPRFLWPILPPTGPYGPAAVLHDFMYRTGGWRPDGPACTLQEANRVLHLAMLDLPTVKTWERWAVDGGVGMGGRFTWRKYRAKEAAATGSTTP